MHPCGHVKNVIWPHTVHQFPHRITVTQVAIATTDADNVREAFILERIQ
jgi:hypothetical protein